MQKSFDPRLRQALSGVSGVHVTPYDSGGAIAHAQLAKVVDAIAAAGIDNIVTAGNTGEFYTLTLEEIKSVYRTAVQATAGRRVVTAGIGRSLGDACALAEAATAAGADLLMLHQTPDPFQSPGGTLAYVHSIADAATLPLVLYVRNDSFSASEFADLISHPRVVAMKYASADIARLYERIAIAATADVMMICGLAETWAPPFYAAGATGFTSGLVNVLPALSLEVRDALRSGDYAKARDKVAKIAPFEAMRAMQGNGCNVTVVKEAMRMLGVEAGSVRPPGTVSLQSADRLRLKNILVDWKLLND